MKLLLINVKSAVTATDSLNPSLRILDHPFIGIDGDRICYISDKKPEGKWEEFDAQEKLITPGLVDPHTHPIFAGNRSDEYSMRLEGISYMDIAKSGGGINKTVRLTRQASDEELYKSTRQRLLRMMSHGTTTIEAKSGYGLTTEDELRLIKILHDLDEELPIEIFITFLGAHEIPPEYKDKREDYINMVIEEMIPEVARQGYAKFCDVFCENGVFSKSESERILETGKKYGLIPKIHANELGNSHGVEAAAKTGAISADHLNYINDNEIRILKEYKICPVLLPATSFTLGLGIYPPARKLKENGITFALASDCNPGSCYLENFSLVQAIACNTMRISPEDAFIASTLIAAKALGAENIGVLDAGMQADLIIWNAEDYRDISYHYGINSVDKVMKKGKWVSF
ncbi:MAG: imidazolonepropionase [Candidatus Coatesbacteria bacterium]|nr:imidazolonepropionase [Candidatus Coatesbacteria bacterium]